MAPAQKVCKDSAPCSVIWGVLQKYQVFSIFICSQLSLDNQLKVVFLPLHILLIGGLGWRSG
jgi:hypothetical protein